MGALAEVDGLAADWRQNINEALSQGNLELATTRLEEANAVFPNDVEWVQLNVRLQNRQRAERIMVSTEALLTSQKGRQAKQMFDILRFELTGLAQGRLRVLRLVARLMDRGPRPTARGRLTARVPGGG